MVRDLWSRLSEDDLVGEPIVVGAAINQASNVASRILKVPKDQVFLITHVVVQADGSPGGITGAFQASPDLGSIGINIVDQNGTAAGNIYFQSFSRWQAAFERENSPNWRNAPPGNGVCWKPKYPIPVPSEWQLNATAQATGFRVGDFGQQVAVYGRLVSEEEARTLGYRVSASATSSDRRHMVFTAVPSVTPFTIIPARTGKSVRILDVHVRMQPETGAANRWTLQQTDGTRVFRWTNNNPSDLLEMHFSPDIYLKPGTGLQSVGNVALSGTAVIVFEYVDQEDVPADAWWACVEPEFPTPAATKVGLGSAFPSVSTQVTCFYPARNTTKTSPLAGFQHIVRGYVMSAQKKSTVTPDQTLLAISTGSAAGQIHHSDLLTSQSNFQISPTLTVVAHDQCVYLSVDDINVPCPPDTGSIWIDTLGTGPATGLLSIAATPTAGDADIDSWCVTIWGKTIPTKFTAPSNRGN